MEKDGEVYVRLKLLDGTIQEAPLMESPDVVREARRRKYPYEMEICLKGKDIFVTSVFGESGESPEELRDELNKAVLTEFLRYCGVDTIYKLYKILEEGEELMRKDLESDR